MKKFTLIEMLVVVAMLGILLSLLLPSLHNARMAAKVAVCASNQKQIGFAIMSYVTKNDSIWPFSPQEQAQTVGTWPEGGVHTAELVWEYSGETVDLFVCPITMYSHMTSHVNLEEHCQAPCLAF